MPSDDTSTTQYTAFAGMRHIATGELPPVALAVKRAMEADPWVPLLVFQDATAARVELDLRGTDQDVVARLERTALPPPPTVAAASPVGKTAAGPGRPKLGVVAREVTLLPRHWDWLNRQPGGASVALRKLVEEARRAAVGTEHSRQAQETTYRFLSAIAGDLPDFEDVTRALFAGEGDRFHRLTQTWPPDIRDYARKQAVSAFIIEENPKE